MKKTYIYALISTLLISVLFLNCKEEKIEPHIELKSVSTKSLESQGGEVAISFVSIKNWTANCDQTWCTLSLLEGKGGEISMTARIDENISLDRRSVKITLVSETVQQTFTISQKQRDSIDVTQTEYTLSANDTKLTFDVATNVELKVSSSAKWIKYRYKTETRAMKTYTLNFGLEKNPTIESREALITIMGSDINHEVKVVQEARVDSSQVHILYAGFLFQTPHFDGDDVFGIVHWGDGKQDVYEEGLVHEYAEEQEYNLTIKLWGAEEIEIPTIQGVSEIDLSEF